jgi:hypothetical protein
MQNRGASSPTTRHRWTGSYRPSAVPTIGVATSSAKVGKRERRSRGCWGDAHRDTDEERRPESATTEDWRGGSGFTGGGDSSVLRRRERA